jgi:hypothetical protein
VTGIRGDRSTISRPTTARPATGRPATARPGTTGPLSSGKGKGGAGNSLVTPAGTAAIGGFAKALAAAAATATAAATTATATNTAFTSVVVTAATPMESTLSALGHGGLLHRQGTSEAGIDEIDESILAVVDIRILQLLYNCSFGPDYFFELFKFEEGTEAIEEMLVFFNRVFGIPKHDLPIELLRKAVVSGYAFIHLPHRHFYRFSRCLLIDASV